MFFLIVSLVVAVFIVVVAYSYWRAVRYERQLSDELDKMQLK